jgi:hypothetical protein
MSQVLFIDLVALVKLTVNLGWHSIFAMEYAQIPESLQNHHYGHCDTCFKGLG